MGYYYKHKYGFSTHSIHRIKQRLNIKENDEFEIKDKIMNLIEKSEYQFETSKTIYIKIPVKNLYAVIDKKYNTIITVTDISASKQLELIDKDK
ncbi:hypothetical protein SCORR_v1c04560 [Spiroplasma corruscae]|uniref:Uncharacterized protein n=1 Tax=Spiroplasma corruscae TaxID=216934 RepID=A0A222EP01_9MOLU|nr:hypothetical protein [Spiroplasma corruscae]ASP28228.1 hypothetical protein SCORR_v1c04560 [Spiroplasma corruscae]